MKVADKLRKDLITNTGKTVVALARDLNMSRPHISHVLCGDSELSIELALKLEKLFGLEARKLLITQLDEKIAEARGK